jgi:tRNA(fMet)-specific endonuclease VapC
MYLLDSTHCIMIMSNKEAILQKIESLIDVPISTCSVVIGELFFGAYKSDQTQLNIQLIEQFFNKMHIYQVDNETAKIYGRIKARITGKMGFRDNDLWISAVAIQHKLIIVSADSDFQRLKHIEDLEIESW